MKKYLQYIFSLCIPITIFVFVSSLIDNIWIFVIWAIFYFSIFIFLNKKVVSYVLRNDSLVVNKYFEEKRYEDGVEFLEPKVNSSLLMGVNNYYKYCLISFNLMLDKIENVDKLVAKEKMLRKSFPTMKYINFLLALDRGNMSEAKYWAEKVLKLRHKMFESQKNFVRRILDMIDSGVVDEGLCTESKYPIVARICSKVKEGKIHSVENYSIKPVIVEKKKLSKKQKILSILLIVLVVLSMIIVGVCYDRYIEGKGCVAAYEKRYYESGLWWVSFVILPFALSTLIYAIWLERKKYKYLQIVVPGIIGLLMAILLLFNSIPLGFDYDTNKETLNVVESTIGLNLSDDFSLLAIDDDLFQIIIVRKNDEIIDFDEKWVDSIYKNIDIDSICRVETKKFEKFLVHPTADKNYIVVAWDEQSNILYIYVSK